MIAYYYKMINSFLKAIEKSNKSVNYYKSPFKISIKNSESSSKNVKDALNAII